MRTFFLTFCVLFVCLITVRAEAGPAPDSCMPPYEPVPTKIMSGPLPTTWFWYSEELVARTHDCSRSVYNETDVDLSERVLDNIEHSLTRMEKKTGLRYRYYLSDASHGEVFNPYTLVCPQWRREAMHPRRHSCLIVLYRDGYAQTFGGTSGRCGEDWSQRTADETRISFQSAPRGTVRIVLREDAFKRFFMADVSIRSGVMDPISARNYVDPPDPYHIYTGVWLDYDVSGTHLWRNY